jgi:hypothetical protein
LASREGSELERETEQSSKGRENCTAASVSSSIETFESNTTSPDKEKEDGSKSLTRQDDRRIDNIIRNVKAIKRLSLCFFTI